MVPVIPPGGAAAADGLLAWAVLCGAALGVGLWTLLGRVPRFSRPRLVGRVAPYVADISDEARQLLETRTSDPVPVFGELLAPMVGRLRHLLAALLGGASVIELRLRQSRSSLDVTGYRSRQLGWVIGGAAFGVVVALVAARSQPAPLAAGLVIAALGGVCGLVLRDWALQRAAAARVARMTAELPMVLEFLTLSLSAGEGILDSLRRVSRTGRGELAQELAGVLAEVNTGLPLGDSLSRCARDIQLPAFTRCVEQVTGALERGSPLAEVLRAQAQDARDDTKRTLLEVAGKKEVAMLLPLVFLILPITILFAIFPGVFVLQVGF